MEIQFNKYQKRGSYHWQQTSNNIFKHNAYVSARYQQVLNLIPRQKKLKILDLGCGDGVLTYLILKKCKADIFGIDTDPKALKIARLKLESLQPKARFKQASAYKLPFKNQSFDLVIAAEIIEHLEKPNQMLLELNRVLKPRAMVIITTPVKINAVPEDKMHFKEYSSKDLLKKLKKYFKNTTIKTSHPLWLKKLYLFSLFKFSHYYFEPFRLLINLWVILTKLNPFLLSSEPNTNQIAVCLKA